MMRSVRHLFSLMLVAIRLGAQTEDVVKLPAVTVRSFQVANQDPAASFAMPVSALRYDPLVDVQARNLAEGQADVTIRGGTFENTGFKLGATSLYDPQTGHYSAEIPVAPAFLKAPEVATGVQNATSGFNAGVGSISYEWRSIQTTGFTTLSSGQFRSDREDFYQGFVGTLGKRIRLGADISFSHSRSDGSIPYGDHSFYRYNGRLQLISPLGQSDLFAGYQSKFFGWPNLYTPYNVNETEDLQTVLIAYNHRIEFGQGAYFQVGAYWRRNKDDYEYNRFIPGQYNPYRHSSSVRSIAVEGRTPLRQTEVRLNYSAQVMSDGLESTSLVFGRFRHRDLTKISLVPENAWDLEGGDRVILKGGAAFDDSNKEASALSPIVEIARLKRLLGKGTQRIYFGYAQSTQVPSYTALNSSATSGLFRGNPNLGRTRSRNTEVGLSAPVGSWSLKTAVFYREDDKLVDWTYLQGVTARTANPVDLKTRGVEAVASRSWKYVDVNLGYTGLSRSSDYLGAPVDSSFYALNYARHRLTAAIVARLGDGLELRMDNEARIQRKNTLRGTSPDRVLLSAAGLAWRPPGLAPLELFAQVENLWNSLYQELPSVPAARRQLACGATYGW